MTIKVETRVYGVVFKFERVKSRPDNINEGMMERKTRGEVNKEW